jgi:hypothetical protein
MTLLLDVHTFLWFCQGDPALSAPATVLIQDPSNRKLLSIASCWEIAIKAGAPGDVFRARVERRPKASFREKPFLN